MSFSCVNMKTLHYVAWTNTGDARALHSHPPVTSWYPSLKTQIFDYAYIKNFVCNSLNKYRRFPCFALASSGYVEVPPNNIMSFLILWIWKPLNYIAWTNTGDARASHSHPRWHPGASLLKLIYLIAHISKTLYAIS